MGVSHPLHHGGTDPTIFDSTKGSIYAYVKSTQVYVCPDDSFGTAGHNSYAVNHRIALPNTGANLVGGYLLPGKNESVFDRPASIMALAEEDDISADHRSGSTNDGYLIGDPLSYRHTDGSHIAYLDGHVKWLTQPTFARAYPVLTGVDGAVMDNVGACS